MIWFCVVLEADVIVTGTVEPPPHQAETELLEEHIHCELRDLVTRQLRDEQRPPGDSGERLRAVDGQNNIRPTLAVSASVWRSGSLLCCDVWEEKHLVWRAELALLPVGQN